MVKNGGQRQRGNGEDQRGVRRKSEKASVEVRDGGCWMAWTVDLRGLSLSRKKVETAREHECLAL